MPDRDDALMRELYTSVGCACDTAPHWAPRDAETEAGWLRKLARRVPSPAEQRWLRRLVVRGAVDAITRSALALAAAHNLEMDYIGMEWDRQRALRERRAGRAGRPRPHGHLAAHHVRWRARVAGVLRPVARRPWRDAPGAVSHVVLARAGSPRRPRPAEVRRRCLDRLLSGPARRV